MFPAFLQVRPMSHYCFLPGLLLDSWLTHFPDVTLLSGRWTQERVGVCWKSRPLEGKIMVMAFSFQTQGQSSMLHLPVQGEGGERSGRGNPSGLIREQFVIPVGAACKGRSTNPRSSTWLGHASSHVTQWPVRSRAVLAIDLDILISAIA